MKLRKVTISSQQCFLYCCCPCILLFAGQILLSCTGSRMEVSACEVLLLLHWAFVGCLPGVLYSPLIVLTCILQVSENFPCVAFV